MGPSTYFQRAASQACSASCGSCPPSWNLPTGRILLPRLQTVLDQLADVANQHLPAPALLSGFEIPRVGGTGSVASFAAIPIVRPEGL